MNKDFIEIVNAAKSGDNTAFESLYNMTKDSAYFVAISIAKNEHDAMDILQESYIKAFESLDTLNQPENFDSWFNRIVSNKSKDWLKKKKPVLFADINTDIIQDWNEEELNKEYIPHEAVDSKETSRLVMEMIDKLPEDKRLIILMYYYQNMSVAQISETLELPVTTVKYKLLSARRDIKADVEDLEKKGTKLYCITPLAIIPAAMAIYAADCHAPAFASVLANVMPEAALVNTSAGTLGGSAAGAAAKNGFFSSLAGKITAAVVTLAVAGAVIVPAAIVINNRNNSVQQSAGSETEGSDSDANGGGTEGNYSGAETESRDVAEENSELDVTEYSDSQQQGSAYEPEYEFTDFTITLGTYNGEPLVWRCVGEDSNGKLMLCDSVICHKSFDAASDMYSEGVRKDSGSNYWDSSCIKVWLNSDGAVEWSNAMAVPSGDNILGENNYEDEPGFLSCFTDKELEHVKQVTQKTFLNNYDAELADGGDSKFDFDTGGKDFDVLFDSLSDIGEDGGWYQMTTEYFFLPSPEQLQMAYYNVGEEYISSEESYWLRLPCNTGMSYENVATVSENVISYAAACDSTIGVRPAYYNVGDVVVNE